MRYQAIAIAIIATCVLLLVFGGGSPSNEEVSSTEAPQELSKRVADLEAEVSSLRAQAKTPNSKRPAVAENSAANELESMLARKVTAAAQAQGLVDENGETSPEVREQLGKIIREEMATARDEAIERRMQRRAERQEAMVEEFIANQGLDDEQAARLTEIMMKEQDQTAELFRSAREDGSWREARMQAQELREQSESALTEILDQQQIEAWSQTRDESRPHRGSPRGPRGRP